MSEFLLGSIAAGAAPLFMTVGFIFWEKHWKSTPFNLNLFKCSLAACWFLITVGAVDGFAGLIVSTNMTHYMLFVSCVIGIIIGDNTWLMALEILGTRRVILVDSLKPFCGALLAYFFVSGETIRDPTLFYSGMTLTVGAVCLCALEQKKEEEKEREEEHDKKVSEEEQSAKDSRLAWGFSLAALNVVLDTGAFVVTKAFGAGLNSFDINLVRFGEAAGAMLMWWGMGKGVTRWMAMYWTDREAEAVAVVAVEAVEVEVEVEAESCVPSCWDTEADADDGKVVDDKYRGAQKAQGDAAGEEWLWGMNGSEWGYASVGVLLVTYCCPALSQYALFQIPLAMVYTLISLGPLYSLPLTAYMHQEPITLPAVVSSVVAVIGVVMVVWGA